MTRTVILLMAMGLVQCWSDVEENQARTYKENLSLIQRLSSLNKVQKLQEMLGADYDRLLGDLNPLLGRKKELDNDLVESNLAKTILGGEGDPDHNRLEPILGGEGDPDHNRLGPILGGEGDPDNMYDSEDTQLTPDNELLQVADYPGKFGRKRRVAAAIKPVLGKSPAKQSQIEKRTSIEPCVSSEEESENQKLKPFNKICNNPSDGSKVIKSETTVECPKYELLKELCGYQVRKYNEGTWILAVRDLNKAYTESYNDALERLKSYLKEIKISFTSPVSEIFRMEKDDSKEPVAAFLSVFLPSSFDSESLEPAKLKKKGLVVKKNPSLLFYVRSFGTPSPSVDEYDRQFKKLLTDIRNSAGVNKALWNMRFKHDYTEDEDEMQRYELAYMADPRTIR